EDRFLESKRTMLADIAKMLGGRVAEELVIGDITTGASSDIERATKIAKQMVTRFGMSEKLGPQTFGDANHEVFLGRDFSANADYSPEIAYEIDKEIARLIAEGYEQARVVLTEHREHLDRMAAVLIERETLDGPALLAVLDGDWDAFLVAEKIAEENKTPDEPEEGEPEAGESEVQEAESDTVIIEPPTAAGPGGVTLV
ncbi:MAG: cell division protein FtsH, partial [Actinomycetota bacterium]|nr:cell division protein FtsH [Actinomycetota bacterium]